MNKFTDLELIEEYNILYEKLGHMAMMSVEEVEHFEDVSHELIKRGVLKGGEINPRGFTRDFK